MNIFKLIIGKSLNYLPYALIPSIGKVYNMHRKEIRDYGKSTNKKEWIFKRTYDIVEYAINNIPFYKEFYKAKGFDISQLKSFDDIKKIPIVKKSDLSAVTLEQRSNTKIAHYLANTGGSTGSPFTFYRTPDQRIKEMTYYHHSWSSLGYKKHKLRFQFVGRQEKNGCTYDFARNQIRASVYEPFENVIKEITKINKICSLEYIQGYPSVIYEFALFCKKHNKEYKKSGLGRTIKGIFLNSEYPNPIFRKFIEEIFGVKTIASYGLSEGCSLAFDLSSGIYNVEQSYGYTEVQKEDDGLHLIATSFDSFAAPFIRYDTNDIVEDVVFKNDILESYTMNSGGRSGQYIIDKNEKRISLTGLIFGKHHKLFDYCSQIQISQSEKGKATVYYIPKALLPNDFEPSVMFDSSGIEITFTFKKLNEPIKTKSGKVLLMVKDSQIPEVTSFNKLA